jgi:hypothetical protein
MGLSRGSSRSPCATHHTSQILPNLHPSSFSSPGMTSIARSKPIRFHLHLDFHDFYTLMESMDVLVYFLDVSRIFWFLMPFFFVLGRSYPFVCQTMIRTGIRRFSWLFNATYV